VAKDRALTVGALLQREFADGVVVGERLHYGPLDLIVRTLDAAGQIETVGLALEPSPRAGIAGLRAWLRRLRARRSPRLQAPAEGRAAAKSATEPAS
jgi:NhaP-type Na+/H+ and K+/H+ antiporter